MLRKRVIPIVLLDGYSVIKTIQFNIRRNLGNPIAMARIYNTRNVDELILLDIDASKEKRHIDYFTIQDVASECFMPLTVGGGLTTSEQIEKVLSVGADKVVVNSIALTSPKSVKEFSSNFGNQCIVVSIDVKKIENSFKVYSHAGLACPIDLISWCQQLESYGAGEIFLNSVDQDGKMEGYDLDLISVVSQSVSVPVIACGGAGSPRDFGYAIQSGASAAAAASIFHFTDITPSVCKDRMRQMRIAVR